MNLTKGPYPSNPRKTVVSRDDNKANTPSRIQHWHWSKQLWMESLNTEWLFWGVPNRTIFPLTLIAYCRFLIKERLQFVLTCQQQYGLQKLHNIPFEMYTQVNLVILFLYLDKGGSHHKHLINLLCSYLEWCRNANNTEVFCFDSLHWKQNEDSKPVNHTWIHFLWQQQQNENIKLLLRRGDGEWIEWGGRRRRKRN